MIGKQRLQPETKAKIFSESFKLVREALVKGQKPDLDSKLENKIKEIVDDED